MHKETHAAAAGTNPNTASATHTITMSAIDQEVDDAVVGCARTREREAMIGSVDPLALSCALATRARAPIVRRGAIAESTSLIYLLHVHRIFSLMPDRSAANTRRRPS